MEKEKGRIRTLEDVLEQEKAQVKDLKERLDKSKLNTLTPNENILKAKQDMVTKMSLGVNANSPFGRPVGTYVAPMPFVVPPPSQASHMQTTAIYSEITVQVICITKF